MKCPKCNAALIKQDELLKCPICFGILKIGMDKNIEVHLADIVTRQNDIGEYGQDGYDDTKLPPVKKTALQCPSCQAPLYRIVFSKKYFHFCPDCKCAWSEDKTAFDDYITGTGSTAQVIDHNIGSIILNFFRPVFDEVTLFLYSISLIYILVLNIFFNDPSAIIGKEVLKLILNVANIFFIIGLILTIYHAFSKRKKSKIEKTMILYYVLVLNLIIGIDSFFYILDTGKFYLSVLPGVNLIYSVILMYLWDDELPEDLRIDERSISGKNASLIEVCIGIILVSCIFFFSNSLMNFRWSISLSILVSYAQLLHKNIIRIFFNVCKAQKE